MKTKLPIMILVVILAIFILWLVSRDSDITNAPPKGDTILAFGDSLVEGVGATEGNDFVSLVEKRIDTPIENFGKAGDTTADGLSRIVQALEKKPDITIILLGGNDALRRVPIQETEENLKAIIRSFQNTGAVVVLLGVRGGILGDPYDEMYEDIASDTRSAYVPNVLKGLFGDSRYMADSIHPNDQGYARIAARVAPIIEKLLKSGL